MRLYLHANQINPALSATVICIERGYKYIGGERSSREEYSNSGEALPWIEGYVLCTRPEEKFLLLHCSHGCACQPQAGQLWGVSCGFLSLSVWSSPFVTLCIIFCHIQQLAPCPCLCCAGLLPALPRWDPPAAPVQGNTGQGGKGNICPCSPSFSLYAFPLSLRKKFNATLLYSEKSFLKSIHK